MFIGASMKSILIASNNQGKLYEIRALLKDLPFEVLSPRQINVDLSIEEDGKTYKENAIKKALGFSEYLDSPYLILADDSGLEVDALNGLPGLYSARFSDKPNATDADRRSALVSRLFPYPRPWTAQFRCVVALSVPGEGLYFSEGICPGEIIPEERGTNGFGYDPVFLVKNKTLTMAELSTKEKNVLSHRARAIQAIRPQLLKILKV